MMSLSPFQARMALLSFLAVGGLAVTNILYFQDTVVVAKSARIKTDRAKARADAERTRRFALTPRETAALARPASDAPAVSAPPATMRQLIEQSLQEIPSNTTPPATGSGRFALEPGLIDRFVSPAIAAPASPTIAQSVSDGELRMPDIVKGIQAHLGKKGYEPGTPDGAVGLVTRAAIMAYEHDNGLPVSGEPSEPLLRHMQGAPPAQAANTATRPRHQRSPSAEHVIRSVQQSLAQLGYFSGKIDGRSSDETVRAIREYEMDSALPPTGRVSAPLLVRLTRAAGGAKAVQR